MKEFAKKSILPNSRYINAFMHPEDETIVITVNRVDFPRIKKEQM
jgi:hypothetical protein